MLSVAVTAWIGHVTEPNDFPDLLLSLSFSLFAECQAERLCDTARHQITHLQLGCGETSNWRHMACMSSHRQLKAEKGATAAPVHIDSQHSTRICVCTACSMTQTPSDAAAQNRLSAQKGYACMCRSMTG